MIFLSHIGWIAIEIDFEGVYMFSSDIWDTLIKCFRRMMCAISYLLAYLPQLLHLPPLRVRHRVPEHLQEHALDQLVILSQHGPVDVDEPLRPVQLCHNGFLLV